MFGRETTLTYSFTVDGVIDLGTRTEAWAMSGTITVEAVDSDQLNLEMAIFEVRRRAYGTQRTSKGLIIVRKFYVQQEIP
jgi:hypothetical protein